MLSRYVTQLTTLKSVISRASIFTIREFGVCSPESVACDERSNIYFYFLAQTMFDNQNALQIFVGHRIPKQIKNQ